MSIAENRPSKWNRDARFRDALAAALTETHRHLSAAARTSLYQQAIAGNLGAFDRIREVERAAEQLLQPVGTSSASPLVASNNITFQVIGIPERAPFASLPPPLELPAASSVATPPAPAK